LHGFSRIKEEALRWGTKGIKQMVYRDFCANFFLWLKPAFHPWLIIPSPFVQIGEIRVIAFSLHS